MLTTADLLILSASSLVALGVLAGLFAWSWKGWLELKRHELGEPTPKASPQVGNRIELADLRERVRKLEAIAAGVDL